MTREDHLKNRILSLNGGEYQALVSDYLERSMGCAHVICLGMTPGSHKTRPGTPDSLYYTGNHYVLMEAGTYEKTSQAERKIEKDVEKCIAYKSSNPEMVVDKIVIAYTCSSVDPVKLNRIKQVDESIEFLGIDDLTHGLMRWPWLVEEHLQIPMPSGQVLDLDGFVSKVDKDPFSPRMSNRLVGREREIDFVCRCLREGKSILFHGPSGTGKTKLALEVVASFAREEPDVSVLCIRSLGKDLYKDAQIALEGDGKSLILVDDINEVAGLRPFLELCRERGSLIVATVRESVVDEVKNEIRVIGDFVQIPVEVPQRELQLEILRVSYGIESLGTRVTILERSRGNLRFAYLMSDALKQGDLDLANNPYDIVGRAYDSLISRLDATQVGVLEILSILGATSIDDVTLRWMLGVWGIDSREFVVACRALRDRELVSLTSLETAVSILEQNIRDFLSYRVLLREKRVGITELMKHGVGLSRLSKYVEILCEIYRSKESIELARRGVRGVWDSGLAPHGLLCERMGALLGDRREEYILDVIQDIKQKVAEGFDKSTYERSISHALDCMRGMRGEPQLASDYVELFLRLVDAMGPDVSQLGEFIDMELSFSGGAVVSNSHTKIMIIESLEGRYEGTGDKGYAGLLLRYARSLLGDMVTRVFLSGAKTTYSNAVIMMSSEVMEVRRKALSALRMLADNPVLREEVAEICGTYKDLWDDVPDVTHDLQTNTAMIIADTWRSLLPLRSWQECVFLCDFLDCWEGRIGTADVECLVPCGSPQSTVRAIRGDGLLSTDSKSRRDARLGELVKDISLRDMLLPFRQFEGAWRCCDFALQTGYESVMRLLADVSEDDARCLVQTYVESGFGSANVIRSAFEILVNGSSAKKARVAMRLMTSGSCGGPDVAEDWLRAFDLECVYRGMTKGVAQEISRHVLTSGIFLNYEETLSLDAAVAGFADEYLGFACGEHGFLAREARTFLRSVEDELGENALDALRRDGRLLAAIKALMLKALRGDAYSSCGLLTIICALDGTFVGEIVDLVLSKGGQGSEEALSVVWDMDCSGGLARQTIEGIYSEKKDANLLGVRRAIMGVVASAPQDESQRSTLITWLSEFAMMSGEPDGVICEVVASTMTESERVRFIMGLVDNSLRPAALDELGILYDSVCCFTGSEVVRVDSDISFLERLSESMHGVHYVEPRRAIEERIKRLRVLRDQVEAREMMKGLGDWFGA